MAHRATTETAITLHATNLVGYSGKEQPTGREDMHWTIRSKQRETKRQVDRVAGTYMRLAAWTKGNTGWWIRKIMDTQLESQLYLRIRRMTPEEATQALSDDGVDWSGFMVRLKARIAAKREERSRNGKD